MNRLSRITMAVALSALAVVCLGGCFGLHGPIDVKNNIASTNNVKIKQEFGISARGSTLRLARGLATQFVDEPIPRLAGVRRAQFGQYRIVGGDENADLLLHDLEIRGWDPVVRITEPGNGEEIRVFAREWNGRLRGILFVQREGEELMLARVKGNLEKVMANILDDPRFGIEIPMIATGNRSEEVDAQEIVDDIRTSIDEDIKKEIEEASNSFY